MPNFPLLGPSIEMMLFGLGAPPFLPTNPDYKAVITPSDITKVIGSSPELDGRQSSIPSGGPMNYYWFFQSIPIGSSVPRYGLQEVEEDGSKIKFTPDVTGFYRIGLIVGDTSFLSEPAYADVYIKLMLVPHGQGIVPDVSFIWDYLGDFWNLFTEREIFSTLWSSYAQVLSNQILSLYQTDFNKSINTIQDLFQKKWLHFDSEIPLDIDQSFVILGDDYAGTRAQSIKFPISADNEYVDQIAIPEFEGKFTTTPWGKKIGQRVIRYWESSHVLFRADSTTVVILVPQTFSLFFTKQNEVLQSTDNHPWRLSPTFGHLTIDFEKEGVKPGDYLKVQLTLLKDGFTETDGSVVYLPIVSVRGGKVGFVYDENLVDGTPSPGPSKQRMLKLASDLKIDGIVEDLGGNLLYLPNSLGDFINKTVNSIAFKRSVFEENLFLTKEIDLGYFNSRKISVSIKPISIVRNKSIRVADEVISIPTLQEFVEQPAITEVDGAKYIVKNDAQNKITPIFRDPLFLYENLDYIIDKDPINIVADFTSGSEYALSTYGDFVDRGVEQGDFLLVSGLNGLPSGAFKRYIITEVVDKSTVKLNSTFSFTTSQTKCKLVRRLSDNYIRFVKNVFGQNKMDVLHPSASTGTRLWSEVTYLDNNKAVEDNFGIIVRLTREQLAKQNITTPYKSAVAGLLYGLVKGASNYNLKIGAQILLGLPFAYYRGVITEITEDYSFRLDLSPEFGRITIEEIDNDDQPTGLVVNYFYPRGAQVFVGGKWITINPKFSGIAINPKTNTEYKIGDVVDQFSPLSKGVEIVDYLTDPDFINRVLSSPTGQLQKYHSFFVRINNDIFNSRDLSFLNLYIQTAKPAYLFSKTISERLFSDIVNITDDLKISLTKNLFDINGLSLPAANKFDYYSDSEVIYTIDGKIFSRYIRGKDLQTTSSSAISAGGGFTTARSGEIHDSPYILAGDRLIIYGGLNQGVYDITAVTNDTTITVSGTPFASISEQSFAIYREIKNPIWTGTANPSLGSSTVVLPAGNLSSGMAVGDKIFFYQVRKIRDYRIVDISGTTITLDRPFEGSTASYPFVVYRQALLTKYLLSDEPTYIYAATTTSGSPWIELSGGLDKTIVKKGDTLYNNLIPQFEILDYDETAHSVYVTPTPSMTLSISAKVFRNTAPLGFPADVDTICTQDVPKITIHPTASTSTLISGNDVVTFSPGTDLSLWHIIPGDFFKVLNGGNSTVDIGYGPGVFVIAEIVSVDSIKLTRPLPATTNVANYELVRIVEPAN